MGYIFDIYRLCNTLDGWLCHSGIWLASQLDVLGHAAWSAQRKRTAETSPTVRQRQRDKECPVVAYPPNQARQPPDHPFIRSHYLIISPRAKMDHDAPAAATMPPMYLAERVSTVTSSTRDFGCVYK